MGDTKPDRNSIFNVMPCKSCSLHHLLKADFFPLGLVGAFLVSSANAWCTPRGTFVLWERKDQAEVGRLNLPSAARAARPPRWVKAERLLSGLRSVPQFRGTWTVF